MFTIALAGRPNVGKSTLFNKLTRRVRAMVAPVPGVTRDSREGSCSIAGLPCTIVDTAGLEGRATGIAGDMNKIAERAAEGADVILFMIDGREGLTAEDEYVAGLLRKLKKPVLLLVNKADTRDAHDNAMEAWSLGFGEPVMLAAEHAIGFDDIADFVEKHYIPEEVKIEPIEVVEEADKANEALGADNRGPNDISSLKLAIVGRPNAGKSTLINTILGDERMLAGDMAGLTRESVGTLYELDGGRIIELVDTPGLRKRAKITEELEQKSAADALVTIGKADVVVLMIDAQQPLEKQDIQIAEKVTKDGRPLVVVINKWDLIKNEERQKLKEELIEDLFYGFHQVKELPFLTISALKQKGVDKVLPRVLLAAEISKKRIGTAKLNRTLEMALEANPPPLRSGKMLKLKFISQVAIDPATFVIWMNRPELMLASYERYLKNVMRKELDLGSVPFKLIFRGNVKANPYANKANPYARGPSKANKSHN